jgi:hypothetical protein
MVFSKFRILAMARSRNHSRIKGGYPGTQECEEPPEPWRALVDPTRG